MNFSLLKHLEEGVEVLEADKCFVCYKPNHTYVNFFMFIEIKFIYYYYYVMFIMNSISMYND